MTQTMPHLKSYAHYLEDGEIYLIPRFLAASDAECAFSHFYNHLAWQEEAIKIYAKTVTVPRLVCWYGNPGAVYRYSGVTHEPLVWDARLSQLKLQLETLCHHPFNSVLANLYRNGQDAMGWHADKEKELGSNPVIASLSLGSQRQFELQHKKTGDQLSFPLGSGDLLIMAGTLQNHWRHRVPKCRDAGPRINLSFRYILITLK